MNVTLSIQFQLPSQTSFPKKKKRTPPQIRQPLRQLRWPRRNRNSLCGSVRIPWAAGIHEKHMGVVNVPPPAPNLTLPAIAGLMIRAVLSPESGRLFVRGRVGCSMLFLEQGSYEWTQFVSVKTGKCPVFMATFGQDREGKMDMKIMHLHFLEVGGLSPENR